MGGSDCDIVPLVKREELGFCAGFNQEAINIPLAEKKRTFSKMRFFCLGFV